MAALLGVDSVRCPVSPLEVPAGLFSQDFIGAFRRDGENHWGVIASSKLFAYCSGDEPCMSPVAMARSGVDVPFQPL